LADFAQEIEPAKTTTPATGEVDQTPQVQRAAQAQSAELTGDKGDPKKNAAGGQADAVREAERVAQAKADWEAVLGKTLGGKAFELIRDNVSFGDLQGYAQQGTKALADLAAKPFSAGKNFSADDAKALNALAKKFAPELQKLADGWLKGPGGQKVFKALSQWVEEHPKAVTAIAASLGALTIGAAVVAIVADADPPEIKQMFKLGKGFEVGGALDLESIKRFAVESAELSMKYSAGGFSAQLKGSTEEGKDGEDRTYAAEASAGYKTKGFEAKGDVKWDSAKGTSAGASVKGEGGPDKFKGNYLASIRVNAEGETEVVFNGGIKTVLNDLPAELKAGLKHSDGEDGKTSVEAELALGKKGDQQTVKGKFDPESGAFTLTFNRTAYEGAATLKEEYSQDKDGNLSTTQSVKYKASDDLAFDMSQKTTGDTTEHSVGLDFTTGKFKNSFDLKMKDAASELSLGTAGKVGDFKLGANTTLLLDDARLKTLGLSLGWQDPDAFKSATLKYKLDWQKDNAEYAHQFESVFEHTVGKWDGRLTGDLTLQGGQVKDANADLLLGRQLNNRWRLIGGVSGGTSFKDGSQASKIGGRLGVQFDNVAVTFGVDKTFGGATNTGFRLEIPLGRKK
jgi:hypothetical protein